MMRVVCDSIQFS